MGFNNENQISMENVYVKGCETNKLVKEYLNKGWELWALNKFLKSCKKLTRRQEEATTLKAYKILLVFSIL